MSDLSKLQANFYKDYAAFYRLGRDTLYSQGMPDQQDFSDTRPDINDYYDDQGNLDLEAYGAANVAWRSGIIDAQNDWAQSHPGAMNAYNADVRRQTENSAVDEEQPYYRPGTQRFDSLFQDVTSRLFTNNGSRFYDKSALYHGQGEYVFDFDFGKIRVGANGRTLCTRFAPEPSSVIR